MRIATPSGRHRALGLFLVSTLALSLSACSRQSQAPSAVSTEAALTTNHERQSYAVNARHLANHFAATDSGALSGDSFASTWRSDKANGHLRFISELIVEAYAVQRERHFEMDSTGALLHYVEHTYSTLQRDTDRGSTYIGTIELEFAGGEAVYRARKTGGTPRRIRQWEVDRVLARAELLRRVTSSSRDGIAASGFATIPQDAPRSHR